MLNNERSDWPVGIAQRVPLVYRRVLYQPWDAVDALACEGCAQNALGPILSDLFSSLRDSL